MKLFIDSDGTPRGTHVLVLGDDGTCLGEIEAVTGIDFRMVMGDSAAHVVLVVKDVPGRYLADRVLINELKPARKVWKQTWLGRWVEKRARSL